MKNATSRTWLDQRNFRIEIANRNSRSRIDQDIENFDDKFETKRRIRNSSALNRKLESKTRASRSRIWRSISRNRLEQRNSRSRIEQRNENFDDKFESKFEKSNRATKRKRRIQNSTRKFKELELKTRIEIRIENWNSRNRIERRNEKDEFEIRLQNTTSRIREIEFENRLQNTTRKLEFETRHENANSDRKLQSKRKSFTTNDRRTARSSLTRNAHTLARNDPRTHTRDTHFKWAVVISNMPSFYLKITYNNKTSMHLLYA